jgi:NADH:ubiquinone oxidoreductase subunit 2 (subunit N)
MLLNSIVSIYYYLAVPREMLFKDPDEGDRLPVPVLVSGVVAIAMVVLVVIFILPNPFVRVADLSTLAPITLAAGG